MVKSVVSFIFSFPCSILPMETFVLKYSSRWLTLFWSRNFDALHDTSD